jgi:low temperature requirement protein LtrA
MLLAALWWAWAAYAWLTNTLNPEEGAVRLAVFGSIGSMLIVSLAVPNAFGVDGVTFGVAYFIVRGLHVVLYVIAGKRGGDRELLRAVLRLAPTAVLAPVLIIGAGFLHGAPQMAVWGAALAVDYLAVLIGHMRGWRVSPAHFVERHGLIVIIALGESIVAIGVGAAGQVLNGGEILAALLGIVVAAALWWSYFDWVIYIGQARLEEASGTVRAALARDLYSYLHLPMVAGIILFAFGMKTTLADVESPLPTIPAIGLFGGLALYMVSHVALRLRIGGGLGRGRPIAALVLVGLLPLAMNLPALASLALVAAVCAGLIAYETIRHRAERAWIRGHRSGFTMEEARELGNLRPRRRRRATAADSEPAAEPERG